MMEAWLEQNGSALDLLGEAVRKPVFCVPMVRAEGRALQRFANEIRATASLEHDNLVRVYDSGIEGDRPFLVMELIEGDGLVDLAESPGGISPSQALIPAA